MTTKMEEARQHPALICVHGASGPEPLGLCAACEDVVAERSRTVLALLEEVIERIESAPLASIGGLRNTHMAQIGVDEVQRWRRGLA